MTRQVPRPSGSSPNGVTALEEGFPWRPLSELAQQESWRKEIHRPLYHIHKWWATRLGSVFRGMTLGALLSADTDVWQGFYDRYDLADKVVLDPFMGSGTTLGETLKLGARAIGSDINPVSTFLVRQAFTPVSETALRTAFAQLEKEVAPAIRAYYQTRDPDTHQPIPVLYSFWCKTVTAPTGEVIPLFARYIFAQHAYPRRKPRAQVVCPRCGEVSACRYDAAALDCPHCAYPFNPQAGPAQGQYVVAADGARYRIKDLLPADGSPPPHRLYALLALRPDGEKIYLTARPADHALYAEAERRLQEEDLPLPTLAVRPGHNTDQARGYHYRHWRDFFNARQLLCLGLLLRHILRIADPAVQEQMLCLFSGTLEFNNLFCSYKGEGSGAVRHMFSHHILKPERLPLENSVWGTPKSSGTFCTLFESRLLRAKRYLTEPFELQIQRDLRGQRRGTRKVVASAPLQPKCVSTWSALQADRRAVMVLNGDSASLPLPDACVDAVVTDPPYFDFVHYSELSDFFFAWLAPVLAERYPWMRRPDCSAPGEVQHRDPRAFARQLGRVFAECRRVLKPDGVLAFSFHHSRAEGWAAIYSALQDAGLRVVAAHPVHAECRAARPKAAARAPISLDAILVCRPCAPAPPVCSLRESAERRADAREAAALAVSPGDRFVLAAAQMLVDAGPDALSYETIRARLTRLHRTVMDIARP